LSEDYNLQTFLLFDFTRVSLQNPLFPEQIGIPADKSPFGFNRMTTDKGGLMELRVWFRGAFRSGMFIGRSGWKRAGGMRKRCDQRGLAPLGAAFSYGIRFDFLSIR
jgi:hypothetical protein